MIIIKVFLGVDELAKPPKNIFITRPNRVPDINNLLATLESNINSPEDGKIPSNLMENE